MELGSILVLWLLKQHRRQRDQNNGSSSSLEARVQNEGVPGQHSLREDPSCLFRLLAVPPGFGLWPHLSDPHSQRYTPLHTVLSPASQSPVLIRVPVTGLVSIPFSLTSFYCDYICKDPISNKVTV